MNYYCTITTEDRLKASPAQYAILSEKLANRENDTEDDGGHGFALEYNDGELYFFADEDGREQRLPKEFLYFFGLLIGANNKP